MRYLNVRRFLILTKFLFFKNCIFSLMMAQSPPLVLKLLASSIRAATRAGKIIRDVMSRGDLGIVEKVGFNLYVYYHCYA